MKNKGYKFAVRWIAINDEPLITNPETVAEFISTLLIADLYDKNPLDVAKDVLKARAKGNFEDNSTYELNG